MESHPDANIDGIELPFEGLNLEHLGLEDFLENEGLLTDYDESAYPPNFDICRIHGVVLFFINREPTWQETNTITSSSTSSKVTPRRWIKMKTPLFRLSEVSSTNLFIAKLKMIARVVLEKT